MSAARICPWTVGAVVVPVPPLVAAKPPVHPKVKVLLAMEPVTLVSLTTKPTRVEPNVEELVPPLATGRIPVTSEVLRLTAPIFSSPPTLLTIPVPRDERVVEPLAATVRKEALLEEATTKIGSVGAEDVPWTTNLALGVVEPIPTLPVAVTLKIDSPMEVETLNGSSVVVPWTLNETVDEEALTPATVPLSIETPLERVEAEVQRAR